MTLPETRKRSEPLIDDLSTLAPGWKIAVFPSGEVKKVKDEGYQPTPLDAAIEFETPEEPTNKDEAGDSYDMEKIEIDPKEKQRSIKSKKATPEEVKTFEKAENGGNQKKTKKILKKKKAAEDSSDDEGDILEEEYMQELNMLEDDLTEETNSQETDLQPPSLKKIKSKPTVKAPKKLTIKKA